MLHLQYIMHSVKISQQTILTWNKKNSIDVDVKYLPKYLVK